MIHASTIQIAEAWTTELRGRAFQSRIPISATLELTSRCNLKCQHCYLGDQTEQHRRRKEERTTEDVKASLNEWAEAGCLYLLITGGDPMMRPDFRDIYRHARELGMVVTVFCDGILVNDKIIELFKELPPRKVEISIYGATAETYETVTRVPGSHARAWKGIRKLHDNGIRVALKTVLMTLNQHELQDMETQADELGLGFRYDAAIFPCLPNGSEKPLDLRVSPETVVAQDLATEKRRRQWKQKIDESDKLPETEQLYTCAAGATAFYADPFGALSPCLMTTHYRYTPGDRSFKSIWQGDIQKIRDLKRTRKDSSFQGPLRGACTHCPAFNYLETGDEEQESDYIRKTTELRYNAVMKENMKESAS